MDHFKLTVRPALARRYLLIKETVRIELAPEGAVRQVLSCSCAGQRVHRSADTRRPRDSPDRSRPMALTWRIRNGRAGIHVDQSHGRARVSISGGMVARGPANGTAVDLSLPVFPSVNLP